MKWASAVSDHPKLEDAIQECARSALSGLDGAAPDLAVVFTSMHHHAGFDNVPALLKQHLGSGPGTQPVKVFGCSGGGIIGNGEEIEQRPALSITVASLPAVDIVGFHLDANSLPDLDAGPSSWEEMITVTADQEPQFVMLADPFSFPVQNLLLGLDFAFSKSVKIGGMASGAERPGLNALFLDDQVHRSGAVGLALHGNIAVDTVVAQGCRPIGEPMRITESKRNLLVKLDGEPPLEYLKGLFRTMSTRDQGLMQHSLFLGVVMDEFLETPRQGDFLIRNVAGMDPKTGTLAIGEMLKEGQLVQFHLRDAQTSAEDLNAVLERYAIDNRENDVHGALLFSCLGRGQYLYGRPNHDTEVFHDKVGQVPLGGFFCNGEIGPVSGTTFLHGYTSSFGIFRPKR